MSRSPKKTTIVTLACAALLFTTSNLHAAHPLHATQADIRVNHATGNLEVTMCVFACDLEDAIGRQSRATVNLADVAAHNQPNEATTIANKQLDQAIEAYVRSCFAIKINDAIKPDSLRWVGFELEQQRVWIYLEIKGAAAGEAWTVQNEIFRELNEDQANRVTVLDGSISKSVVCVAAGFVGCRPDVPVRLP